MVSKRTVAPAPRTVDLQGKSVVITGRLASMTQPQAAELIREHGGEVVPQPTRSTDYVVVGQDGWPLRQDGRPSESLEKAHRLQRDGAALEIIGEQQFLDAVRGDASVARLYTTAQLSRLLEIPGSRIRTWVRKGLIEPKRVEHRLEYFDFQQVASVKLLAELVASGVAPERIRTSLTRIRGWLPEEAGQLLGEDGELLVRLDDGSLAEPSGQLRLAFDEEDDTPEPLPLHVVREDRRTEDDLFAEALELEAAGKLEAAGALYHRALLLGGPRAEIVFNLGNVLYALGRQGEALQRYLQVLELDPEYTEAWNNLGSVLAEEYRFEEAIVAFQRALALAPDYPDAHYNLAEAFIAIGDADSAEEHARRYYLHDPHSHWAVRLRRELRGRRR